MLSNAYKLSLKILDTLTLFSRNASETWPDRHLILPSFDHSVGIQNRHWFLVQIAPGGEQFVTVAVVNASLIVELLIRSPGWRFAPENQMQNQPEKIRRHQPSIAGLARLFFV
jgi:hypothetical protein